jgi:hypothetical protein
MELDKAFIKAIGYPLSSIPPLPPPEIEDSNRFASDANMEQDTSKGNTRQLLICSVNIPLPSTK